jgi:Transposase DNA-binding/Transposase DDE domain
MISGFMLVPDIGAEMRGAKLGDARLEERVGKMARALAKRPGASLPTAMESTAAREAAYRFLSNWRVSLPGVLAPHIEATAQRARNAGRVLLVSDTTEFKFSTEREGLGVLSGQRREGFLSHVTLAVSADGKRTPLGVLAVEAYSRPERKGPRDHFARKRDGARESLRWRRCAEQASSQLADDVEAIHVMDREADIYELMSALSGGGQRFVIRSGQNRLLGEGRLDSVLERSPKRFSREVPLSARSEQPRAPLSRRLKPVRKGRLATLAVSSSQISLNKPRTACEADLPDTLTMNVVRVWEENPPPGQEPVEWRLFTTEPADSDQQLEQIVDAYRARWIIEEYFKALKSGCNFENSQLESYDALQNLLGIYFVVAWQLLLLRSVSRDQPDRPATDVLTPKQLTVLRLLMPRNVPLHPTVADATNAIATLGAHIKSNGPPGWQVLGRGFEELRRAEHLHTLMISSTSRDQS